MERTRLDVIVDIETLGIQYDDTIFQIAAVAFDIHTGKEVKAFNRVANIEDDVLRVDGSTLKWWLNTDRDLLARLLNEGDGSTRDILFEFWMWLQKLVDDYDVYLWGNGIIFDNAMLRHQIESMEYNYPIFYRNDRDIRTLVEAAANRLGITQNKLLKRFNNKALTQHDAIDDCRYQMQVVTWCYNYLAGREDEKQIIIEGSIVTNGKYVGYAFDIDSIEQTLDLYVDKEAVQFIGTYKLDEFTLVK